MSAFRAANVAMTALNLWWFGRMVAGLVRLVRKGRGGAEVVAVCVKNGGGGGGRESAAPGVVVRPAVGGKAPRREE